MPLHGGCSSVLVLFGWFCIEREKDSGPTSTLSATRIKIQNLKSITAHYLSPSSMQNHRAWDS